MNQVLNVQLPPDLLGATKKIADTPGVPVVVPRTVVTPIDQALRNVLAETLLTVRERERSTSTEALKLRIR